MQGIYVMDLHDVRNSIKSKRHRKEQSAVDLYSNEVLTREEKNCNSMGQEQWRNKVGILILLFGWWE